MWLLEAATNFLKVFIMSATIASQRGRVQVEQSDMCLAMNITKMTKGGFSCAATDESQYLFNIPRVIVRQQMTWGVGFPGNTEVKAAIWWQPAMLRQNHSDGCLPCQNGTAKNLQTHCRCTAPGAPPPNRCRQLSPEHLPPLPGMPPAPPGYNAAAQCSQIINLPAGYMYSHASPPSAEFCTLDECAQDSQQDTDFDPDMLTDEGTSTSLYIICCVVIQLTSILKTRATYWANLPVMMSMDQVEGDFGEY